MFKDRCWSTDTVNISAPAKAMVLWWESNRIGERTVTHRLSDKKLSLFANMCIRHATYFENFLFLSTAHMEFFRLYFGRLDAYRYSYGLHFNEFSSGKVLLSRSRRRARLTFPPPP